MSNANEYDGVFNVIKNDKVVKEGTYSECEHYIEWHVDGGDGCETVKAD